MCVVYCITRQMLCMWYKLRPRYPCK